MRLEKQVQFTTRDGLSLKARRLTRNDAKALQAFFKNLSAESYHWFMAHALDDDTVAKAMTRSEGGDDLTLGLFDGGEMVGYFFLWYFNSRVPLLGIGLADAYQRRGLGKQCVQFLVDRARENGNEGVELTTMKENEHAYALYRQVGFEQHADVDTVQGDGSLLVERAMFCPLKPDARPMKRPHKPPA